MTLVSFLADTEEGLGTINIRPHSGRNRADVPYTPQVLPQDMLPSSPGA